MSVQTCIKCNYSTSVTSRFKAHLNRKTPCTATVTTSKLDNDNTLVETHVNVHDISETNTETTTEPTTEPTHTSAHAHPQIPLINLQVSDGGVPSKEASKDTPQTQRQIMVNCIKVETADSMHATIYLLDECIKRPDPNPDVQKGKLYKCLSDFVQIYYSLIHALQYRDHVLKMFTAPVGGL